VLHEVTGLPVRYGGSSRFHISPSLKLSPFYNKDFMINFINTSLDSFGELISARSYYEHDFSWIIEWGMKPLEETVDSYHEVRTIRLGRLCAHTAANAARDMFNNYDYNEEIEEWYYAQETHNIQRIPRSGWCSIKIELSFDAFKNMYVIHLYLKRNSQENSEAYYYISKKILNDLNAINSNILCLIRKNYLLLLEGLPLETGRDNVLTYLLNDEIVKAVCEFMG